MFDAQIDLFEDTSTEVLRIFSSADLKEPVIDSYDYYIVAFSAGKDSICCFLKLLKAGVPPEKIELWHHCVDGYGNPDPLMDWPVTEDYCRKFAAAFGVKIFFSWKVGGFEGEMLRKDSLTKPTCYELPDGTVAESGGVRGKRSTRLMFPQLAASLSQRWCSSYLKIDVASKAISGQKRFNGKRTLFLTGERAQESSARAKYQTMERHRTDGRDGRTARHVDHWRPIHGWDEKEVWSLIEEYKIRMHPAYLMGWSRLSCATCIFGSGSQWASVKRIDPKRFERIAAYEEQFGKTIHRTKSIREQVIGKEPYPAITDELARKAMSFTYEDSIFMDNWELPAGAFGESAGPT